MRSYLMISPMGKGMLLINYFLRRNKNEEIVIVFTVVVVC